MNKISPHTQKAQVNEMNSHTFKQFDTINNIMADVPESALDEVEQLCTRYSHTFNRFSPESELYALNHAGGEWVEISEDLLALIDAALHYCKITGGLFDITMGSMCALWDFHKQVVPHPVAIKNALAHVGWEKIEREGSRVRLSDPRATIDLGGIAKGYIADGIAALLRERGATHGIINLGGNVLCLGEKAPGTPWKVGLRAPIPSSGSLEEKSFAAVSVSDKSVVTSGIYERAFIKDDKFYHHILDPRTGLPAITDVISASVISDKSIDGDGLSTALVVMGVDAALEFVGKLEGVEVVLLSNSGEVLSSAQ